MKDFLIKNHKIAIIVSAITVIAITLLYIFIPRTIEAKVIDISWKNEENIRAVQIRHGSGWGTPGKKGFYNEEPFNLQCNTRYYGTEKCRPYQCNPHRENYQCQPHSCMCRTTCQRTSSGMNSCSQICNTCYNTCSRTIYDTCYNTCPVYKKWCEFDYNEWPVVDHSSLSGHDKEPKWFGLSPKDSSQRLEKISTYTVIFEKKDKRWTYHPKTEKEYYKFNIGSTWVIKVNHAGGVWPQRRRSK